MKTRSKFAATIAVFCIYLMLTLPIAFAQTTGHYIQVNIKSSDGSKTLGTANLPSFDTLITKEIKPVEEQNNIFIKLDFTGRQHQIKKGYVWLCKSSLIDSCLKGNQPSYTFEKFLQEKRVWSDVGDLSGGANKFPQTGNLFTLINLNVNGQDVWIGSFDVVTRTGSRVSEFTTKSSDLSTVDVLLKEDSFANITRDFISNNFVLPKRWLKEANSIILGTVNNKIPKAIQHFGFQSTQSPESFNPPGKVPGNLISPETFNQYELLFGEGSLSNPITVFNNPSGTCGNNQCESNLGETSANCCNDCSCSVQGFVCNKDQRDQNKPGVCTDTSTLQLINRGVKKTNFKTCEIDNKVEVSVEVVNAPAGTQVNDFFYQLDNKTKTDINCNQAQGTNKLIYDCEFTIESSEDCRRGPPQTLKNNAIYTSVVLPDSSIKELNTPISDFTIQQSFESFNDITDFTQRKLKSTSDRLEKGVNEAEDLIDTCVGFIKNAVNFAYVMVAFSLLAVGKQLGLGETKIPFTNAQPFHWLLGDAPKDTPATTAAAGGSNQPSAVVNINPAGLQNSAQSALFGASKTFLESIGVVVDTGLSICEVANTLLQVYVKISEALTSFTTFEVCVKTYQNMIGRGACTGNDPDNPEASISAALQCTSQLQQCTGYLTQASSQLDGLSQHTQTASEKFKKRIPAGSKTVSFYLEEQNAGKVQNTCDDRNVLIGIVTQACEGDAKVSMQKTSTTSAASDIQLYTSNINSEIANIRSLITQLTNTPPVLNTAQDTANVDSQERSLKTSAVNIQNYADQIFTSSSALPNVKAASVEIKTKAGVIVALKTRADQPPQPLRDQASTIRNNLNDAEFQVKKIEDDIKASGQPKDITSSVYGPWATLTPASNIFNEGDGRYVFTFECPGVNAKSLPVDYVKDCSGIKRAPLQSVGVSGPSSKFHLQIVEVKNGNGVPLRKQLIGSETKYFTNTNKVDVKLNNIDVENQASGQQQLKSCYLKGEAGIFGKDVFKNSFTAAGILKATTSFTLDDKYDKKDVSLTYFCEGINGDTDSSAKETIILDKSLTDAQIQGTVPQATGQIPTTGNVVQVNAIANEVAPATLQVTLSVGSGTFQSNGIDHCKVKWGDSTPDTAVTGSGQQVTHTYNPATGSPFVVYACYKDATETQTITSATGPVGKGTFTLPFGGAGGTTPAPTQPQGRLSPTIVSVNPQSGSTITQGQQFPIQVIGRDDPGLSVKVEYDLDTGTFVTSLNQIIASANGEFQDTYTVPPFNTQGLRTIIIRVTDVDGQSTNTTLKINVTQPLAPSSPSSNPPTIVIVSPTQNQNIEPNKQFDVVIDGSDDRTGSLVTLTLDFGAGVSQGTTFSVPVNVNGGFTYTYTNPGFPTSAVGSTKTITVKATDSTGQTDTETTRIVIQNQAVIFGSQKVTNFGGAKQTNGDRTFSWSPLQGATKYIVYGSDRQDVMRYLLYDSESWGDTITSGSYTLPNGRLSSNLQLYFVVVAENSAGTKSQLSDRVGPF